MSMSKHARLSTNTEFYPSEIADSDSSVVYKEVPYIVLKATKDFQYANQVFEVQLENAEWLETKQDGDTLYIEDNTYVANDAKDPIEFLPGGTSSSTGDTTTSEDAGTLEKAYIAKATTMKEKADAYIDAKAAVAGLGTLETAMNTKKTAYETAQDTTKDAEKDYTDAKTAYESADIDKLTQDYKDAYAKKSETGYQEATATVAGGAPTAPSGENPMEVDEANTFTKGKYALKVGSGANTSHLVYTYFVENGTDEIVAVENETDPANVTDVSQLKDPDKLTVDNLTTAAKTTYDEWVAYEPKKEAYDKAQAYIDKIDGAISDAAQALDDIGATANFGDVDVSGITTNIENLKKAWDAAVTAEATAKKDYEDAVAAYNEAAGTTVTEAKTAFEAALAERNAAGAAYLDKVGRSGVGDLAQDDQDLKLCDSSSNYASGDKDYASIGVEAVTMTTAVKANVDIAVGSQTLHIKVTKKTNSTIIVETDGYKLQKDDEIRLPLFVRTTGGVASVSIDGLNSEFTSEGKTFSVIFGVREIESSRFWFY